MNDLSYLILSCLIVACSTHAQMPFQTSSQEKYKLNGPVQSMTETAYQAIRRNGKIQKGPRKRELMFNFDVRVRFDRQGHILEEAKYYSHNALYGMSEFVYGPNGRIQKEILYRPDGTPFEEAHYQYNEKGQFTAKIYAGPSGEELRKETFEYDDNGLLIRRSWYEKKRKYGWERYFYNPQGLLIQTCVYGPSGNLIHDERHRYSPNGRRIEVMRCNAYNCYEREQYHYDAHGRLSRKILYDADSEIVREWRYDYDTWSNLRKVEVRDADNHLLELTVFEYRYDAYNNWTQKTIFRNGEPISIIERRLGYYDPRRQ